MKTFKEYLNEGLLNMMKCKKLKKKLEKEKEILHNMYDKKEGRARLDKQKNKCGNLQDDMYDAGCK